MQKLKGLNKENQQIVNQLIDTAQNSMNQLAAAAQEASTIANAPPDIPPEQFNLQKGTACTPQGAVTGSGDQISASSVASSAVTSAPVASESSSSTSTAAVSSASA